MTVVRADRVPAPTGAPAVEDRETLAVEHCGDDRFAIRIRGHVVVVDQPTSAGGGDLGPTPTELFVAGLASCVGHYARRYLARHQIDPVGLAVVATYRIGGKPARVLDVELGIRLPAGFPVQRRDALLAVASHCTVHNSLEAPPEITLRLVD